MKAYHIGICQHGNYRMLGENISCTEIIIDETLPYESELWPHPHIKDVNLFPGEIIMILYKYFLSPSNTFTSSRAKKFIHLVYICCSENRHLCYLFQNLIPCRFDLVYKYTSNNQTFFLNFIAYPPCWNIWFCYPPLISNKNTSNILNTEQQHGIKPY